ncbi:MAG: single-stranded-DNA-specific exonuclease RecJ, partial [Methylobacter sp.]|nr:single-stranded-DNA-specific exonuclease RecJ [Methylobacter sp.]
MYYQGVKKTIVTRPVPKKRAKLGEMHPVLERIFLARDLTSTAELDRTLAKLPSPWLLSGMEEMVGHLIAAINEQQRICIVADF